MELCKLEEEIVAKMSIISDKVLRMGLREHKIRLKTYTYTRKPKKSKIEIRRSKRGKKER